MTVKMRSRLSDLTGKKLTDEYTITFHYDCWDDELSITYANDLGEQAYLFGSGDKNLDTPTVT